MNRTRRFAGYSTGQTGRIGSPPATTVADLFTAGLKHHQAGHLAEAETLYRQTLAAHPNHADALHLLGVIASQVGRHELAVQLIDLAIHQDRKNSLYHSNRGLALRELNRFEEALESYDRALALSPNYLEALFNRGVILQKLNRLDEALKSYNRLLAMRPDYAEALSNRGVILQSLKRFEDALQSYDRALAASPNFAEALSNRGNVLKELRRFEDALESYDRSLAVRPDNAEVAYNRGNTLQELNRFGDALESYDRALAVRPNHAETLFNRGAVLQQLNRFEAAIESYDQALVVRPDYAEALLNRGVVLQKLKRFDHALESYDRVLAVRPDYAEAFVNRGAALHKLRRFNDALESHDRALAVRPDHAEALSNRGITLQELQRFNDALESYDQALAVRPDSAEAFLNRGNTLQELKRFDEALECYDRALAINPGYPEAHWNRALLQLLTGSFVEGWRGYEWRRKMDSWVPRSFEGPEWAGTNPAGKRLLLYSEQGFGDTIQFARYASLTATRGARVALEVQPSLKSLLTGLTGVEMVVAKGEPLPPFDLHCPLLSLPALLGTTVNTIPADVPYIHPAADRVEMWKNRLPHDAALVGLVWSGSPGTTRDHDRSIAFERLAPVLLVPDFRFVSLQKDVRASDGRALRGRSEVIDLGSDLKDFSDTCAVVSQLDLVITVDTAVAHLAGAMGKPVWILLPYMPDFRWLLDRGDSPWYPSARVFRNSEARNWDEVISRVAKELAAADFRWTSGT